MKSDDRRGTKLVTEAIVGFGGQLTKGLSLSTQLTRTEALELLEIRMRISRVGQTKFG